MTSLTDQGKLPKSQHACRLTNLEIKRYHFTDVSINYSIHHHLLRNVWIKIPIQDGIVNRWWPILQYSLCDPAKLIAIFINITYDPPQQAIFLFLFCNYPSTSFLSWMHFRLTPLDVQQLIISRQTKLKYRSLVDWKCRLCCSRIRRTGLVIIRSCPTDCGHSVW